MRKCLCCGFCSTLNVKKKQTNQNQLLIEKVDVTEICGHFINYKNKEVWICLNCSSLLPIMNLNEIMRNQKINKVQKGKRS